MNNYQSWSVCQSWSTLINQYWSVEKHEYVASPWPNAQTAQTRHLIAFVSCERSSAVLARACASSSGGTERPDANSFIWQTLLSCSCQCQGHDGRYCSIYGESIFEKYRFIYICVRALGVLICVCVCECIGHWDRLRSTPGSTLLSLMALNYFIHFAKHLPKRRATCSSLIWLPSKHNTYI